MPPSFNPDAAFDFLALGALVHRLDPGTTPFRAAHSFDVHVSGGEYNVAANLAHCFGKKTAIASALVNYPIGDLVQSAVRAMGVTPIYKTFEHDGARGPNIATVYSDRGAGCRAPVVFYNRANEAAALLKPGDFDWKTIFKDGVRWFHTGGIFAALSESATELTLEAIAAAKAAGAVVSFDLNYRSKLWQSRGGESAAIAAFRKIVQHSDVLFGLDGLGIADARIPGDGNSIPESNAIAKAVAATVKVFPNLKAVACGFRVEHSASRHDWAAALSIDGQNHFTPTMELDVLDRIGGGDGFAAGIIYGLLTQKSPEQSLRLGWAHGALLTTFPGDVTMAKLEDVEALARGGSARVQR